MPADSPAPLRQPAFCLRIAPVLAAMAGAALALMPAPPARSPHRPFPYQTEAPAPVEITGSIAEPAAAPPLHLAGPLPVTITQIVDGDTVEARVQVWLGQDVATRIRLRGIDAPELAGACGAERQRALTARDRLAQLTAAGPVWIAAIGRDKYFGRVVARLIDRHGADLGAQLVQDGLARPYHGGRRDSWCRSGS